MKQYASMGAVACVMVAAAVCAASQHAASAVEVLLKAASTRKTFVSGYPIPLRISFTNRAALPFCFGKSYPPGGIFACRISRAGSNAEARTTFGGKYAAAGFAGFRRVYHLQLVPIGRSSGYGGRYPLAHLYDLTLPGRYHIRLVTRHHLYSTAQPGKYLTTNGKIQSVGARIGLGTPAGTAAGAKSLGRIRSNTLTLTVLAPYRQAPAKAIVSAGLAVEVPNHPGISFVKLPARGALPILLQVYLQTGKAPVRIRLTGNPLIDFSRTQVAGPDGFNGDHLVTKPKPHYEPIPDWKEVPSTAYGKWLVKHKSPKGLKWKRYTLQPGVVYKYAVPINLGCQFDMSLSGNYHVRLRLAHTHIWSAWANVVVPPG